MLPKSMWDLLLRHRIPVIACGDPFQIPPIHEDEDNHMLDYPHIFLTEIMRQAADSDIINLSMRIREGKPIPLMKGTEAQVYLPGELSKGMLMWADEILVATNRKRKELNDIVRAELGFHSPEPQIGDKIISCENHWDIVDSTGESALVNGTIGKIIKIKPSEIIYPSNIITRPVPTYRLVLQSELGEYFNAEVDKNYFLTGEKTLTPKQEYRVYKNKLDLPCTFDYGYAITGHRAQGSEWEKVLVVEEFFPNIKEEHARWLYTSVTRSSKKCVLIKK